MENQLVLVTGASGGTQGATGSRVTRLLREKGTPVRAFVRKDDERTTPLREIGAEIFVGDLLNIQSVREAMKGVEKVYFCYPVQAGLLEATAILTEAAKEEGVKFIFQLSLGASSDQSLSPWGRKMWLSEKILNWSGIPSFHLRAAPFFENLFRQFSRGIQENSEIRAPFGSGDGKVPLIAAQDVARLALVVLLNPDPFIGKTPQLFTANFNLNELAQQLTMLLGRTIRYREISTEEWITESIEREGGTNQEGREHLIKLWKQLLLLNQSQEFLSAMSQGHGLFQMMTGDSPTPLSEWLRVNFERAGSIGQPTPFII
jgi:uncharacterized protein YbjT (DUF2867 family)